MKRVPCLAALLAALFLSSDARALAREGYATLTGTFVHPSLAQRPHQPAPSRTSPPPAGLRPGPR